MNNGSVLVFDFDGTISDSAAAIFDIVNELSEGLEFRKIKSGDLAAFRRMSTEEMITELKIPKESLPEVMAGFHEGLAKKANSLKPIKGIAEALTSLVRNGYQPNIVTSNTEANVNHFLKKFNIDFFNKIYPEGGLYRKSNLLNRLVTDLGVENEQVFFIGDETRDIKAGKNCQTKTVAVTWGLNGREALLKEHPDWLIDTPEQLLEIF